MKITLKGIEHTNRVGKQSGKAFVSCSLKIWSEKQQKDVFISGFGDEITKTWNAGDEVEVDIEQKDKYLNFKLNENSKPSPDRNRKLLEEINFKLDLLLKGNNTAPSTPNTLKTQDNGLTDPDNQEITAENIPF